MSEFFKGTLDEAADRINWLESSIAEWRSVALAYSREAEAARATSSSLLDQVAALKAERDAAVKLAQDYAREAYEDVQNWGAFASGYFQIEWNLEGDLQKWLERGAASDAAKEKS